MERWKFATPSCFDPSKGKSAPVNVRSTGATRTAEIERAARWLLDALDRLDAFEFHRCEREVYKLIRQAAAPSGLAPIAVWNEAVDVEGDPVRRQRKALGEGWRPNLS